MQLLIILFGLLVLAAGIVKQLKNVSIGYEYVPVPGFLIAVLGLFIVLLGCLCP